MAEPESDTLGEMKRRAAEQTQQMMGEAAAAPKRPRGRPRKNPVPAETQAPPAPGSQPAAFVAVCHVCYKPVAEVLEPGHPAHAVLDLFSKGLIRTPDPQKLIMDRAQCPHCGAPVRLEKMDGGGVRLWPRLCWSMAKYATYGTDAWEEGQYK